MTRRTTAVLLLSVVAFPLGVYASSCSLNNKVGASVRTMLIESFKSAAKSGDPDRLVFGPDAAPVVKQLSKRKSGLQPVEVLDLQTDLLTPMAYFGHLRLGGTENPTYVTVRGDYACPVGSLGDGSVHPYGFPIRTVTIENLDGAIRNER